MDTRQEQNGDEDEHESSVGEAHDDVHGVKAQDAPRWWYGWRDGRGPTGTAAILTRARSGAVFQRLGAAKRVVVHGSNRAGKTFGMKNV